MKENHISEIEKEDEDRVRTFRERYFDSSDCDIYGIFKYARLRKVMKEDCIYIPNTFDKFRILSAIPLHSAVFVELCSQCLQSSALDDLKPFLETGCVIPVMLHKYSCYAPELVMEVLRYPHISSEEYEAYRFWRVMEKSDSAVCNCCLESKYSEFGNILKRNRRKKYIEFQLEVIQSNLAPFVDSDSEFLEIVGFALDKRRYELIDQVQDLSYTISSLRTGDAFASSLLMSNDDLLLAKNICPVLFDSPELNFSRDDAIISGLELGIPEGAELHKYLEVIMSHKAQIKNLTDRIIRKSQATGEYVDSVSYSGLLDAIATVNEEIRRVQRSRRYKLLSLVSDITAANKGLIATLLSTAALGCIGSLKGCGATAATGLAGRLFGDKKVIRDVLDKIRVKGPTRELKELICDLIQPSVQRLIAFYLGTDLMSIQTWHIREKVKKGKT